MLKFSSKSKGRSDSSKRLSNRYKGNYVPMRESGNEVLKYTVSGNNIKLGANQEVIAKLNEKLREIYVEIYDIISRQFGKNDDQQVAFFDIVCFSCVTDILNGVNYIQSVLDVSIGYQVTELNVLSKEPIGNQHDIFCSTCIDRMVNLRSIARKKRNKVTTSNNQGTDFCTMPVIQGNISDPSLPSTSQEILIQSNRIVSEEVSSSVEIEYEVSRKKSSQTCDMSHIDYDLNVVGNKSSEFVFIIRQRRVIVDLIEKIQVIIKNLLQIFNDPSNRVKAFKKGNMNRPIILVKLFKLDLEISKIVDLMNRLCLRLEELSNQLSVMVLDRGQSHYVTERTNLGSHDSVRSLSRAFTLNRVTAKKKESDVKII